MKPSRWRLLGYLLLIACACAVLVRWYSGRRQGPFWDKYQKVQLGMTDKQVEDILGPTDDIDHFGGGFNGTYWYTWRDGEKKIVLTLDWDFSKGGYELHEKKFYPQSAWEKIEESPHDLYRWVKWNLPW
jgi:hypothetical protein